MKTLTVVIFTAFGFSLANLSVAFAGGQCSKGDNLCSGRKKSKDATPSNMLAAPGASTGASKIHGSEQSSEEEPSTSSSLKLSSHSVCDTQSKENSKNSKDSLVSKSEIYRAAKEKADHSSLSANNYQESLADKSAQSFQKELDSGAVPDLDRAGRIAVVQNKAAKLHRTAKKDQLAAAAAASDLNESDLAAEHLSKSDGHAEQDLKLQKKGYDFGPKHTMQGIGLPEFKPVTD